MAGLVQEKFGDFQVKFRIAGMQFKPSLRTKNRQVAEDRKREIERTLELIEEDRIQLPEKPTRKQIIEFVMSGGKVTVESKVAKTSKFQSVVDEFLKLRKNIKAKTTYDTEAIHCRNLTRIIKQKELPKINTGVLQKYAAKRLTEKGILGSTLSPDTVHKELVTFATVWSFAITHNYIDEAPCPAKGVELPKIDEKDPFRTWDQCESLIDQAKLEGNEAKKVWDCLFLSSGQVLELVDYAKTNARYPFIYAAIAIAAFTGARRSEIMRSEIGDWDFDNDVVRIRSKKASRKKNITFRDVPIHPKLKEIMKNWLDNHHPGGKYTIMVPPNLPHAVQKSGGPVEFTPDKARTHFVSTFRKSKWEVLRGWHVLRHSFCSNLAREGVSDAVIDAWMGHQGDEAVKKRYRHLFPQDSKKIMDRLFS